VAIVINSNTAAFDAIRNLELTSADFAQAVQRLSSGLRINSAADDPSGLAISEGLLAQANGFQQAASNMQAGVSMLQAAQAGLNQTQAALQRLDQLAIEASNGTLTSSDRLSIQQEVQSLLAEIDQVAHQTSFNNIKLLDGSAGGAIVQGGGPDVAGIVAQAGVAMATSFTLAPDSTSTYPAAATRSAIESDVAATGTDTFSTSSSLTIVGGLGTETFSATAGETLSQFFSEVNGSSIGVTISIDTNTDAILIANNNYGGVDPRTGVQEPDAPAQVNVSGMSGDFAAGGQFEFTSGSSSTPGAVFTPTAQQGSVDASGTFTDNPTSIGGASGVIQVTTGGGSVSLVTASGINADTIQGSGDLAGITITLGNPGVFTGGDTFTVTQSSTGPLEFQTGPNSGDTTKFAIDQEDTLALGIQGLDLTTQAGAESAITAVQNAISRVSAAQANLGAIQNVFTDTQNNDTSQQLNLLQARSNLVDADIPQEVARFARDLILLQTGAAVLAQANQEPGLLVRLLLPGTASGSTLG
jgi:flagellin